MDADGQVWAQADPGAVARILRILVDNALRHGGEADVAVRASDGEASLTVHDTGPGVSADDAERIFRRFERGQDINQDGGFGLGLAIGRELARKMGGELALQAPGPGATFVARFPAHEPRA
jgi:signal transduction histidine kinase